MYGLETSENYNPAFIRELRLKAIDARKLVLKMLNTAGSGHTGGSLSCIEILLALQFATFIKSTPENPLSEDRDIIYISKGHACPSLYAIRHIAGYDIPEDELYTLREIDSRLQGHPDYNAMPGIIEGPSGSLGQGLSIVNGMALSDKRKKHARKRMFFAVLGDGEIQEGQIWESAMTSSQYNLDNVCSILDNNGIQLDGYTKDIKNMEPVSEKWKAFGWKTIDIDGHNFEELLDAYQSAVYSKKPTFINAHTVKGKGVSIFENNPKYHGIAPTDKELAIAFRELEQERRELDTYV